MGELLAPVLRGVLYDKAGYSGIFGLGSGILALDFIVRILLIEKRVAARYNSTVVGGAANARHHFTETGDAEANEEADEDDALLPKKEEEQFKYRKSKTGLFAACQFCTVSPTRVYRLFCWWLSPEPPYLRLSMLPFQQKQRLHLISPLST